MAGVLAVTALIGFAAASCEEKKDVSPVRTPDIVLDQPKQVVCFYEANPTTTARTWKGPTDCSLRAWLADEPGGFRIRAVVTDDVHDPRGKAVKDMSEGDCLRLTVRDARQGEWEFGFRLTGAGRAEAHCWSAPAGQSAAVAATNLSFTASRAGTETTYEIRLPFQRPRALAFKADDSDGEGRDLWIGQPDPVGLNRAR